MTNSILDISKQVHKEDILNVLDEKYSTLGPLWVIQQMEWNNTVYSTFKDHDKFLILIILVKKALDFYSRNFIKLSYEEFYLKNTVEIEKFNIEEISKALNVPKESARRKVQELENVGAIIKKKHRIIIDRSKFSYSKPINSIKRISRFLATLSEMCVNENVLSKRISSESLEIIIKDNFSYIWKIYYEMQLPMMMAYKHVFKDLETFHIYGTCVVNQHLYTQNINHLEMNKDEFIKSTLFLGAQGINAMSISDITGIPRATVIRKLQRLVLRNNLKIDNKKHYRLSGVYVEQLKLPQSQVFDQLANFSTKIFNFVIL